MWSELNWLTANKTSDFNKTVGLKKFDRVGPPVDVKIYYNAIGNLFAITVLATFSECNGESIAFFIEQVSHDVVCFRPYARSKNAQLARRFVLGNVRAIDLFCAISNRENGHR